MRYFSIWLRVAACLSCLCTEAVALQFADGAATVREQSFTCEIIRSYVSIYGEKAAERWAKRKKWSSIRIAEARACLK